MIVRSFDTVLDGAHPHLLIEHLEGPSLRRLIRRGGPLPLQQLVPLALTSPVRSPTWIGWRSSTWT